MGFSEALGQTRFSAFTPYLKITCSASHIAIYVACFKKRKGTERHAEGGHEKMKTRKTSMYLRSRWKASGSGMVFKEEVVQDEMSLENGRRQMLCSFVNYGQEWFLF